MASETHNQINLRNPNLQKFDKHSPQNINKTNVKKKNFIQLNKKNIKSNSNLSNRKKSTQQTSLLHLNKSQNQFKKSNPSINLSQPQSSSQSNFKQLNSPQYLLIQHRSSEDRSQQQTSILYQSILQSASHKKSNQLESPPKLPTQHRSSQDRSQQQTSIPNRYKLQSASQNKSYQQINDRPNSGQCLSKKNQPLLLENIGANCYLNSALQGISSCDKFVTDISKLHKQYYECKKLNMFYKLLCILNGSEEDRIEISRNQIFREWNKPGQQDSFELLAYVINQVYGEIKKYKEDMNGNQKMSIKEWLKIELPMKIIIKYVIRCECDKEVNVPLQSDLALHVSIPSTGENDLQTLVDQFFVEDEIQDYHCDNNDCDGKKAIRYMQLCKPLPRTICIHLQRTYWNGNIMVKINKKINFSKKLKIKNIFCSFKDKSKHSCRFDESEHRNSADNSDETFSLTSVIVHSGSVSEGHYTCYKFFNNQWFLSNDSQISKVEESKVLKCQAYILFYEKV